MKGQQITIREVITEDPDAEREYDREVIAIEVTAGGIHLRARRDPTHNEWHQIGNAVLRAQEVLNTRKPAPWEHNDQGDGGA